jgi:hypothetical protein
VFKWFYYLGQSSNELVLADCVYKIMLNYHRDLVVFEAKRKAKAEEELKTKGKTKLAWNDDVEAKEFVWSIDVLERENALGRTRIAEALEFLEYKGFVKLLFLKQGMPNFKGLGDKTQCYCIPLERVLGQRASGLSWTKTLFMAE